MRNIILLLALLVSISGPAQSYQIDWFKIAGGGGASTSGVYSVSGTIGQSDAGAPMAGGGFSLTGGFWSLFAVPTPGAPSLTILLTTTNTAVVAWPAPSAGFVLQENPALDSPNWATVTNAVNVVGEQNQILVAPPVGNRFYRLFHP